MDARRFRTLALRTGRSGYRRLPAGMRARARTLARDRLGAEVELRRVRFAPTAPVGMRPGLRPFTIEAPPELFIPQALVKRGLVGYEPYALETFLALLDHAGEGAVLDVGANVGLYALLAGARGGRRVVAFEPTPRIAAAARRSARVSDLPVRVEAAALGEREETVTLYLSDTSDASNSLDPSFRRATTEVDVPGSIVDAFCERHRLGPAVVKIDTETTEPEVLRGARATIARHRPYLLVEVLPGRREGAIDEVMAGFGYTAYHLDGPPPLRPADRIVGRPGGSDMFLLAPEPMPESFWGLVRGWREALGYVRIEHNSVRVRRLLLDDALAGEA